MDHHHFYIKTPLGELHVYNRPENLPGVYIKLVTDRAVDLSYPLACEEYESLYKRLQSEAIIAHEIL